LFLIVLYLKITILVC